MGQELNPPNPSPDTASLVKRLAGPSTTKAGLAKDQSEINRIIAEASKGSKFYDNEKRKDKELTERINKILKQRDDARQGVDISQVEKSTDHILDQLESHRDLSQIIVHVDMDAFYANVELLHNPELKGKPFGVGAGVLSTASYDARKYGVRSGMPGFIAKKLCPELILVNINFTRYQEMSDKVMDIFRRYDSNMLAAGCDEGYLNVTSYCEEHNLDPEACVQEMRATVHKETNLTVSAGIAPNKMLAKICSDKNKPNGQFYLPFDCESIKSFMQDLPIRRIPGIGRVNERLLDAIGIKACGDIYTHRATLSLMDKQFGLQFLLRTHLGIASNAVEPGKREERKSIGAERTFSTLSDRQQILNKLEEVAAELEDDTERNGWTGKTVTLKYKLNTYQVYTRAKSFDRWISTKKDDLFAIGKELLPSHPLSIRLIGLRITKLKDLRSSSPAGGIKRFLEPTATSPHKKAKFEATNNDDTTYKHDLSDYDQNEHEDCMPGFGGQDDGQLEAEFGSDEEVDGEDHEPSNVSESNDVKAQPRPPVSAPARSNSGGQGSSSMATISRQKPRSSGHVPEPKRLTSNVAEIDTQTHTCPICGKNLATDNQGLNAHIDFCLSRGAILHAQAESSSPTKKKSTSTWNWEANSEGKRKR